MTNKKYKKILFPDEVVDFIISNAKGRTNAELTELVNKNFATEYKVSQIDSFKANNHITSGLTGQFQKGNVPANKGKKMSEETYKLCSKTMFKKGLTPANYRPVGSTRIDKDGYCYTKVKAPNKWELTHRLIWEKHYGEIPAGSKIVFLDGNKSNLKIENLACVKSSELAVLNRKKMMKNNSELTKTSIAIAKLKIAIGKKKKQK